MVIGWPIFIDCLPVNICFRTGPQYGLILTMYCRGVPKDSFFFFVRLVVIISREGKKSKRQTDNIFKQKSSRFCDLWSIPYNISAGFALFSWTRRRRQKFRCDCAEQLSIFIIKNKLALCIIPGLVNGWCASSMNRMIKVLQSAPGPPLHAC